MATKKQTKTKNVFNPEAFSLGFNFKVKDVGTSPLGGDTEEVEEVITLAGYANFSGNTEDDSSCFIDRTNDVVVPDGIDVANYKKSPVILFQHNRDYVIGKAVSVTKKKDGLYIEAEIHAGAMEDEDFYAIKNGLYTSFSIGFRTKKGEWKQMGESEVFFITKSELLEVSVVAIPCNTNSTFSIVKSYEGNIYAGDFDLTHQSKSAIATQNTLLKEDLVKLKLRDLLPEDKVKELTDLGMGASLDEPQDVDTKAFIEALVSKEVQAAVSKALDAFRDELTKAAEAPAQEETKEDSPAAEEETKADEEAQTEEKQDEVVEEEVVDVEVFKSMSDEVAKLKALFVETK